MILLIDNYDSFTWNLADLIRRQYDDVRVFRNDALEVDVAMAMSPKGIVISPGPGRPENSGVSLELVRRCMGRFPILGVCLGHQLLGELCGMDLVHGQVPVHGKTSNIRHNGKGLFEGLPQDLRVMRYHSLELVEGDLPQGVEVTARTAEGVIMGIRHKLFNFSGVQFHPESVLTDCGDRIINNWLRSLEQGKTMSLTWEEQTVY